MRRFAPALLLILAPLLHASEKSRVSAISGVTLNSPEVPRYEKLEISFSVNLPVDNPYDPDEIDVRAVIRTPSGKKIFVPAFFYQGYVREAEKDGGEKLFPNGRPMWKVRYAPLERGKHSFALEIIRPGYYFATDDFTFRCVSGDSHGFLRASGNKQTFEFDDGTPWFAVGLNTCWGRSTYDFDNWFGKLATNGGNYGRLWVGPMFLFALEEQKALGRYNDANAWRLDHVTELAAQKNIFLMLCLESFNSVRIQPEYERWNENPYNAANGGPCETPPEFFTDERARELFKRRLRYICARWGYSTHVLAWEFWNEVDLAEKYESRPVRDWHVEMSRYLRRSDPNKRMHSTSFANSEGDSLIDLLPEMDFVQTHNYGATDIAADLSRYSFQKSKRYGKPHFVGEFGLHWEGKGNERDKEGAHLIEGIWSAGLSQSAGTAMTWWWDNYVDPMNLWPRYAPFAKFAAKVDWKSRKFKPAETSFSFATPQSPHRFDISLQGARSIWEDGPLNSPQTVTVKNDGAVLNLENLSGHLHGNGNHPTWQNPVTFVVENDARWMFCVVVAGVNDWGGATLKISVDDELVLERNFVDDDLNRGGTMNKYDGEYIIPVPPGAHRIVVLNDGRDWIGCKYRFIGYGKKLEPTLRAFGESDSREALLWIQNETASYRAKTEGVQAEPVKDALLTVRGLNDGDYTAEIWNTLSGAVDEKAARSDRGALTISLPTIDSNVGLRVFRK
jgi:hypothetical protein